MDAINYDDENEYDLKSSTEPAMMSAGLATNISIGPRKIEGVNYGLDQASGGELTRLMKKAESDTLTPQPEGRQPSIPPRIGVGLSSKSQVSPTSA